MLNASEPERVDVERFRSFPSDTLSWSAHGRHLGFLRQVFDPRSIGTSQRPSFNRLEWRCASDAAAKEPADGFLRRTNSSVKSLSLVLLSVTGLFEPTGLQTVILRQVSPQRSSRQVKERNDDGRTGAPVPVFLPDASLPQKGPCRPAINLRFVSDTAARPSVERRAHVVRRTSLGVLGW